MKKSTSILFTILIYTAFFGNLYGKGSSASHTITIRVANSFRVLDLKGTDASFKPLIQYEVENKESAATGQTDWIYYNSISESGATNKVTATVNILPESVNSVKLAASTVSIRNKITSIKDSPPVSLSSSEAAQEVITNIGSKKTNAPGFNGLLKLDYSLETLPNTDRTDVSEISDENITIVYTIVEN